MTEVKKVGVVAMPIISTGGGFQRVARDLIAALNSKNIEVSLLTPFRVDLKKIAELYGPITIDRFYYPNKMISDLCRIDVLGRKLLRKQFRKMARAVDFIIDLDGGVFHRFLPNEFDKNNYIVWRLSCINPETHKLQQFTNWKILVKKFAKKIIFSPKDRPAGVKIYPLDEWTKREIEEFWRVKTQNMCLYPEIKVKEFTPQKKRKRQMVVLGRIAPNKSIDESLEIFYHATKNRPEYRLVILGGVTPDSEGYIEKLQAMVKAFGIQERVLIVRDPSFEQIKEVLSESEILIDSQRGVSLTMTAIEAMASGCVVLAQKNAGTFKEVLENGKYGYGFSTKEEGARVLDDLLSKNKIVNAGAIARAEFFSSESFKKRLELVLKG